MTQSHCTTKPTRFTHLSAIERGQIAAYRNEGLTQRAIAVRLGRNPSTISREIQRGAVEQIDTHRKVYTTYFPDAGARVYEENRRHCGTHSTAMQAWDFLRDAEKDILNQDWAPDVVVGNAKRLGKYPYVPCTKTLYNWIDEGKLSVINMDLAMKVRRSTKKTRSRQHKKVLGTSIDERPDAIETRETFGHWEIDTVLGHKSQDDALLTLVERKTRHKLIRRVPSQTAPAITDALQAIFSDYREAHKVFKTITADNGSEFSDLAAQGRALQIDVYFAHPYAAWERGSNERHNGLLRRYIKKGQPIHAYSDERIEAVRDWMNTLPRKILHYQTPEEMFEKCLACVA